LYRNNGALDAGDEALADRALGNILNSELHNRWVDESDTLMGLYHQKISHVLRFAQARAVKNALLWCLHSIIGSESLSAEEISRLRYPLLGVAGEMILGAKSSPSQSI
jgi:hypothetical protein